MGAGRLRRTLLVRYRSLSSNRTAPRTLHPYHLFNHRGDWYVAGWDEARKQIRIFALHRIRRTTLGTASYEIPPTFRFDEYMADAFAIQKGEKPVAVSIRVAPRQARWIRERRWHKTARVQERLDGGLVLQLRVAETSEIRRWILQFGGEAEVLAPESLRAAVARELEAALGAYGPRRSHRKGR